MRILTGELYASVLLMFVLYSLLNMCSVLYSHSNLCVVQFAHAASAKTYLAGVGLGGIV